MQLFFSYTHLFQIYSIAVFYRVGSDTTAGRNTHAVRM